MTELNAKDLLYYHDQIIKGISDLVKLPTVYDAATITEKMPYGKNVYQG
jgi:hypothetical protein